MAAAARLCRRLHGLHTPRSSWRASGSTSFCEGVGRGGEGGAGCGEQQLCSRVVCSGTASYTPRAGGERKGGSSVQGEGR